MPRTALRFLVLPLAALLAAGPASAGTAEPQRISGDYYDWTRTLQPEKPWNHAYHQKLVMKLFLCAKGPSGPSKVHLTFGQALEVIRKLDHLTLGIPKIVYLVGWQFDGHDSKYPAWDEVNAALKRPEDAAAVDSLRWLMREARRFNTVVSLHINMIDAFPNSPLWETYLARDVIAKDASGRPIPGEWHGERSYQLSYAQEWELGLAQRRIDGLLELLPELREGGTVHIDAFHSMRPVAWRRGQPELMSPWLGYSDETEIAAQRKIFRYWKLQGVDVTCEGGMYNLRRDPFIGLQAMAWHYHPKNFVEQDWLGKPADFQALPPHLYIGTPMQAEQEVMKDPVNLTGLQEKFCLDVIPWYFRNSPQAGNYIDDRPSFSRENLMAPVLWRERTFVALSKAGAREKVWTLPRGWGDVRSLRVSTWGLTGPGPARTVPVNGRQVTLDLEPGQPLLIEAQ